MKNILLVVMLFISGISIAQNLPADVFGIRDLLLENGDPFQRIQYLTRSNEELCHNDHDIADVAHRYVRIPSSGRNIIGVGTDVNNLTNYTVLGSFAPQPRTGFYGANTGGLLSSQINWNTVPRTRLAENDPTPCETRVTEIRGLGFSGRGDGHEIISFSYHANKGGRFRVEIVDIGDGNPSTVRLTNGDEYYEFNGDNDGPVAFTIPQREIGNMYEIRMFATSDSDLAITQVAPIIEGTRIISIDSRGLQFVVAKNGDGSSDNIWLDRKPRIRGTESNRLTGRFKQGAISRGGSDNGFIKRYAIHFGSGELRPYETIALVVERSGNRFPVLSQLNGPVVRMTWHVTRRQGASSRRDDSFSGGFGYSVVSLPPGWDYDDMEEISDDHYGRYYTGVDGVHSPYTFTYSDNPANGSAGSPTNWELRDNWFELGYRFRYAGHNYTLKIWDHISHGDSRLGSGNQSNNHHDNGGVFNEPTSEGMRIGNIDHSGSHATTNGNQNGRDMNFNTSW